MNTAQVTACHPGICVKSISQVHRLHSKLCILPKRFDPCSRVKLGLRPRQSLGLKWRPISQSQKPLHICLAGGKGMMGNDEENSPWKSIEQAIGKFKGQSIEDVLRRQIEKGEYYDGGGSGVKPPGGGGNSGSGGGSPDGSGESEEESPAAMWEENLQVVLATLGFIFLYIYILTGEELTKLARDYIKYLFSGSQTVRLKNALYEMGLIYESMTAEKEEQEEFWLEKAILGTPTWFHNPADYREPLKNYLLSGSSDAIAARNYLELDSDEAVRYCLESDDEEDNEYVDEDEDEDEEKYEDEDKYDDEDNF
ncbi:uncharacterized protein LOC109810817 isoform X2 [Cajanus cajan]|uniref:Uncharacterized protein n=2 Tax=Cajanus cajan TaxID=3821 RepID=A0A151SDE7_CAJCA|nr:uncharacterized protein LOC109810817 isoform X2 [Cajanus cajan]KYP52816.1 hypothetical protein KK1_025351 [Cajanus cajan]